MLTTVVERKIQEKKPSQTKKLSKNTQLTPSKKK